MADVIVTVGEHEVTLRPPASHAIRWEILVLSNKSGARAAAAALGACWRGSGRPSASYTKHGYDCGAFGGAVMDELLARGIPFSKIVAAGTKAIGVLSVGLVSAEAIDEAEAFTGAGEAASTG